MRGMELQMIKEYVMTFIKGFNEYSGILTMVALLVSAWSLWVALRALGLKCGNKIIGYYTTASSIDSDMPYIKEILLQNLKDKEVAIHDIFIRFGRNIYLDMLNKGHYDHFIHVLPPMGTLYLKFGPAYRYSESMNTVDISHLIMGRKYGKIILSTNQGRINVGSIKSGWSPIFDYFRNYRTQVIQPHKFYTTESVYSNNNNEVYRAVDFSSYGDRVSYLVTLKINGKDVVYRVFNQGVDQIPYFSHVSFTPQSLQDENSLRAFLKAEKKRGHLQFDSIVKIINLHKIIEQDKQESQKYGSYKPIPDGWFTYRIIGKLQTEWWNLKQDIKNLQNRDIHYNYHFLLSRWYKKLYIRK